MQQKIIVSCRYRTISYFFLTAITLGLTGCLIWGAVNFALEGMFEVMLGALCFALVFGILSAMLIGFIKNYAVLFCEDGIVFRNLFGKSREYSYAQVKQYRIFRNPISPSKSTITICTAEKNFVLNAMCSNFNKACEYLEQSGMKKA